jgi:CPA2 family monovalent cation:H+ antiporter-2
MWALRYSPRAALTVAIGLAQIGEFSFILAGLAASKDINMLTAQAQSLLVACSIVSIMLNPLIFRGINPLERWLRRRPELWRLLSQRSELHAEQLRQRISFAVPAEEGARRAIVVGHGPVGRTAAAILKDFEIQPVIIDLNVDSVASLNAMNEAAVYGDAARREILEAAGIRSAQYLLITVPELETRTVIALVARELNPHVKVFVRARYLDERAWLDEIGVTEATYEEAEAAIGLASLLLKEVGADEDRIEGELRKIRARLALQSAQEANEFRPEDTATSETAVAGDTQEKH